MMRASVPGFLALLAAAPLTVCADDKAEPPKPAAEVKPAADAKPADAKPAEAKPADAKPADAKPTDAKPADAKPAEAKPAEAKPAEAKPADAKPAEAKPAEAKPAEAKPADAKPAADAKAGEAKKAVPMKLVLPAARLKVALDNAAGAAADDDDEDADDSKTVKLSEEDSKALDEFVQKALKAKRRQFEETIRTAASAVSKEQKLSAEAEKKLSGLTGKAVDAALPDWEKAFRKWMETMLPRGGGAAKALSSWSAENYARNSVSFSGYSAPDQTDAWKAVLMEVLTPEQLKAHDDAVKAAEKKFQEDFGDYLATCEGQAGDQMSAAMEAELARISQYSGLDAERQKKLKTAGDEAVKQCVKDWRGQVERQLRNMDEKSREQTTGRGGMMSVNMAEKANQPTERAVWKDAVAAQLNEQERANLEKRTLEVKGRRTEALAIILLNELDRLMGFTAEQRSQFQPIAAKRLLKLPSYYFTNPENGGYYSLDMGQMLQLVQKVKDDELKGFLSEPQLKRFRAATGDQLSARSNSYTREKLDMGDMPKPEEMDEVEVERLLSRYLHREAKRMKLKMFSTMEAQVEHVTRVTSPDPALVTTLTTAAKGAAEEMAQSGIANLSSWLRGQFQNVKPSDVPGRLENLYTPYFSSSDRNQPAFPAVWTGALQRLLSEEQRKLWKAETDVREKWRQEALSAVVITELEKRLVMNDEQRTKLTAKLSDVIKDYEPDFNSYFSFGWHLQGYYSLIPVAMLSEKEMAEYFDKKQIEVLKERALTNASQYAEMIRNNHNSRIRRQ